MPILLKDLIKESPEEVIIGKYARETLNWYDNVAYAFITFPTFSLICRNSTHGNILRNVNSVIRDVGDTNNTDELKKLINEFFDKVHLSCSDIDAFIEDYKTGVLGNIIKKHGKDWFLFNMPELRGSPVSLHGRAWPEKKIISCWNNLDDIKKNWNAIENMFSYNKSKIGKLNDYTVDYLDRDSTFHKKNVLLDLIPAKDIKNSDGKKSTLTPEEIRDLQQKLHTLPPAEKKQAMIKLGMVDFDANRNDARMNFMRGAIAEGKILLKDLLNTSIIAKVTGGDYDIKAELNESKYIYSDEHSYEYIINDLLSKFNKITNGLSDGRVVRDDIPNMSSIGASLNDYYISIGIYDIPLSEFSKLSGKHYTKDGTDKINYLVDAIKASNEINPLIVVIDNEGLYVLEGGHRSEALYKLGAKSLPAKLVIDKESFDI